MGMLIPCFICHIVYLYRIEKSNIAGYNCSDSITNELIRKGTEDNSKMIIYIKINIFLDVFQIAFNCFVILIGLCLMVYDKLKGNYDEKLKEVDQSQDECNEKNDTNQNSEENNLEIPINSNNIHLLTKLIYYYIDL